MKCLVDNDTIQIEITNACRNRCANCTRYVGLAEPYMMDFETFKAAVDSMDGFPHMTGIMGGEPLLHPEFEKFCDYALSRIGRVHLGLWTCLPKGFEHYREIICRTFGNVFFNDHTRRDIYHHPFLVAAKDVVKDRDEIFYLADRCYFQRAWSSSINPKGAYFCEMAAAFAMLCSGMGEGWNAEPGWWKRTPKDYGPQVEEFCEWCGGALFLKRRASIESRVYDISESMFRKLAKAGVDMELDFLRLHDLKQVKEVEQQPLAAYKDPAYRDMIAARYGIFLTVNECRFNEPHLMRNINSPDSIFARYRQKYAVGQ